MSQEFLPVLGMVGSLLVGSLLQPKPPSAPRPAPAPKAPEAAPLPTPPPPPAPEPTISPADAQAAALAKQQRSRRLASDALDQPVLGDNLQNNTNVKTLLGQ